MGEEGEALGGERKEEDKEGTGGGGLRYGSTPRV
jgi:hypothetical protein